MGKINKHLYIANLISRELLGAISKGERSELCMWREQNTNEELYKEIKDRKGIEGRKKIFDSIKLDEEWRRFNYNQKVVRQKSLRISFLKYAAVLLPILFVSYFLIFLSDKQIDSFNNEVSHVVVPGESKAELILSSGKRLDLSSVEECNLKETNGINIKNRNNELSYLKDSLVSLDELLYNTINIPKGGEYVVTLSDGTKVWINSMSSLKYPVNFDSKNRVVELSGEAFFEVVKDKSRPFVVKMKGYNVKVLGTSFNISSYDDENLSHTTLATGKVEIYGFSGETDKSYRIIPGEQFVFNEYTGEAEIREVNVKVYTAWKDGYFMFDETKFEDVLLELQRWYGVEVFYINEDIKEEVFTGKLPRFENLNIIMEMMNKVGNINYRLKGNVLYIK